MEQTGSNTYREIMNQPESWHQTLNQLNAREILKWGWPRDHQYVFIGCGTSFHLAFVASRLFQSTTGLHSVALTGSDGVWLMEEAVDGERPLTAFLISRSGSTTEMLWAAQSLRERTPKVRIIGLTCEENSPLANLADQTLILPHAREQSVVMTQSFTNMLLALQRTAVVIAGDEQRQNELARLPGLLRSLWPVFQESVENITSRDNAAFIFWGLGAYLGLAAEATLKLKEMTQTPCEAYNPFEFRHGPLSMVDSKTHIISFERKTKRSLMDALYQQVGLLGASVTALADRSQSEASRTVYLNSGVSDFSRSVLYVTYGQWLAYHTAKRLGVEPDKPRHLSKVVELHE